MRHRTSARDTTMGPARSEGCGKFVFDSRYRAKVYAKGRKWKNLSVYSCDKCGLWHLTSETATVKAYHRDRKNPDLTIRVVGVFREDGTPFESGN